MQAARKSYMGIIVKPVYFSASCKSKGLNYIKVGGRIMSRILVAYFSASGVTAKAAKMIAEAVEADLYEIRPEVPYTQADLNWRDDKARNYVEMHNLSFRPAIADKDADIAAYDVIFLGFPIWWHIAPTIINTFLESYDFSGKTIILFATSGSEGFGKTTENLLPSVSTTTKLIEGIVLNRGQNKDELTQWVKNLNL
jgi:flavodoxin